MIAMAGPLVRRIGTIWLIIFLMGTYYLGRSVKRRFKEGKYFRSLFYLVLLFPFIAIMV